MTDYWEGVVVLEPGSPEAQAKVADRTAEHDDWSAGGAGSPDNGELPPGMAVVSGGSGGSGYPGGSERPPLHRGIDLPDDVQEVGSALLDEVRAWLARHITAKQESDLDLLTLWAAHTHMTARLYTTPRLQVDSPVPESGKTTVLEHLERLTFRPVLASSISSPALLARLVEHEPRTLLLDEVDRTLDPKRDGVGELVAILNSGYKTGATRPTLVPVKGGRWEPRELSTFAPVAMAGNQPQLPDDTRTRVVRVLLLPDWAGRAEESDWELIDTEASMLGARLARWARHADVTYRPALPPGCVSRFREKWQPLARLAHAAGGRWPLAVQELAAADVAAVRADRDAGLAVEKPAVLLLRHLVDTWPQGQEFVRTTELVDLLASTYPDSWGPNDRYAKGLTVQRFGRMLANVYSVRSAPRDSADKSSPRGYRRGQFGAVEAAMTRPEVPSGTLHEPPDAPEPPEPPERVPGSPKAGEAGSDREPCPLCSKPTNGMGTPECWQHHSATAVPAAQESLALGDVR